MIIDRIQKEMLTDSDFKLLCEKHGLPWDPANGYEPRWYNGPNPADVSVLFVMAEPGPITETERANLLPAVSNTPWLSGYDLSLQEHYWRKNLLILCQNIWPENTIENMQSHLAGTSAFWMSLPHGKSTNSIPREIERFFIEKYFNKILKEFNDIVIIAAGSKARDRLKIYSIQHFDCWAFTRPGCNNPNAKLSWIDVGQKVRKKLKEKTQVASNE